MAQAISVIGSRSTTLSAQGYAQLIAFGLPNEWWPVSDVSPGGVTYPLLLGWGTALAELDQTQLQSVLSAIRLQTSTEEDIDSWAFDFLGTLLPQLSGEPDPSYIARIIAWLQAQKCTLAGIQAAVNAYNMITQYLPTQSAMGTDVFGGLDTYGSVDNPVISGVGGAQQGGLGEDTSGSLDNVGGYDVSTPAYNPPSVIVFDIQSNPILSTAVGLTAAQFCVYFKYPGYSDTLIHPIAAISNVLTSFVNAVKAEGTKAIYANNLSS